MSPLATSQRSTLNVIVTSQIQSLLKRNAMIELVIEAKNGIRSIVSGLCLCDHSRQSNYQCFDIFDQRKHACLMFGERDSHVKSDACLTA